MNESSVSVGELTTSVHLHVSRPTRIDLARAVETLTNLDWFGSAVVRPAPRDDLRRVSTNLELAILNGKANCPIRKSALIDFGAPQVLATSVAVEIGWQSATLAPLFPVFAGHLQITATGLDLEGRYAPPFGRLGLLIDANILHLAARRTADAFLAKLAAGIVA